MRKIVLVLVLVLLSAAACQHNRVSTGSDTGTGPSAPQTTSAPSTTNSTAVCGLVALGRHLGEGDDQQWVDGPDRRAPREGLSRFHRLAVDTDPDIAWIVRANRKKAGLRRLLET